MKRNPRFEYRSVVPEGFAVYLDGKRVGTIKPTKWAYFPGDGTKGQGEDFGSVKAVKESIEAE